jgi:ferredoxin
MLERGAFPSHDCKRGECGACLTRVLAGTPVHRDIYQTDEERAGNEFITVCVSRAKTRLLVLDA